MKRGRVVAFTAITALTFSLAAVAPAAAGQYGDIQRHPRPTLAALVREQRLLGYLPAVPMARYLRIKARLDAAAAQHARNSPLAPAAAQATDLPAAPSAGPSANGLADHSVGPSDSTGAIGPDSYIEMVNLKIGIYNRNLGLITSATLGTLTGEPNYNMSDPQVFWDPATSRFYFAVLNVSNSTLEWGFSKSANPTSIPGSFCNYDLIFGPSGSLPDYPKLGDTRHDLLVGVNLFKPSGVLEPDVAWISKPGGTGTISTCPAPSSFRDNVITNLSGGLTFTPDPAVQTDPSTTGWVVATPLSVYNGPVTSIALYKVTEKSDGTVNIPTFGTSVTVRSYSIPPGAPQLGSIFALDTLDARTMHAVTATDPLRGGTGLWTAITVAGGAGSMVRWYEINVANSTVFQTGTVFDRSVYIFNAGISPDRAVTSSGSAAFGSDMVLGVTGSDSVVFPADFMVSKVGNNAQSNPAIVHAGPANDMGKDCLLNNQGQFLCRWGDYSGATPDPAASQSGSTGRVWLTQMYATGGGPSTIMSEWGTWNWAATP